MRKRMIALLAATLMIFAGCSQLPAEQEEDGYRVYYLHRPDVDHQISELTYENWAFDRLKGADLYTAIIQVMKQPENPEYDSVLPNEVKLKQVVIMRTAVVVTLSEEFDALPEYQKSLITAAITLSLTSTEAVSHVKVIAANREADFLEAHYYSKDSFMMDDSVIRYSTLGVTLYYIRQEDSRLVAIQSTVKTEEGDITPRVVLEALFAKQGNLGNAELEAPFGGKAQVVQAEVTDKVCALDLLVDDSEGFDLYDVYAVVNTLCNHPNVEGVVLTVNGMYLSEYGMQGYDGVLSADRSLVE